MSGDKKPSWQKSKYVFLAFVLTLIAVRIGFELIQQGHDADLPSWTQPGFVVYVDTTYGFCGSCFSIVNELEILRQEMDLDFTFVIEDEDKDLTHYMDWLSRQGLTSIQIPVRIDIGEQFKQAFSLSDGSKILFFDSEARLVSSLPLRALEQPKLLLTLADL